MTNPRLTFSLSDKEHDLRASPRMALHPKSEPLKADVSEAALCRADLGAGLDRFGIAHPSALHHAGEVLDMEDD